MYTSSYLLAKEEFSHVISVPFCLDMQQAVPTHTASCCLPGLYLNWGSDPAPAPPSGFCEGFHCSPLSWYLVSDISQDSEPILWESYQYSLFGICPPPTFQSGKLGITLRKNKQCLTEVAANTSEARKLSTDVVLCASVANRPTLRQWVPLAQPVGRVVRKGEGRKGGYWDN